MEPKHQPSSAAFRRIDLEAATVAENPSLPVANNGYPPFAEPPHTRVRRRVARTQRNGCHPIKPGDVYLEWTEFPGGEAGYADHAGHPVRMVECGECARRYGRAALLEVS